MQASNTKTPPQRTSVQLNMRVDRDLKDQMIVFCQRGGVSMSWLVQAAVRKYLARD